MLFKRRPRSLTSEAYYTEVAKHVAGYHKRVERSFKSKGAHVFIEGSIPQSLTSLRDPVFNLAKIMEPTYTDSDTISWRGLSRRYGFWLGAYIGADISKHAQVITYVGNHLRSLPFNQEQRDRVTGRRGIDLEDTVSLLSAGPLAVARHGLVQIAAVGKESLAKNYDRDRFVESAGYMLHLWHQAMDAVVVHEQETRAFGACEVLHITDIVPDNILPPHEL